MPNMQTKPVTRKPPSIMSGQDLVERRRKMQDCPLGIENEQQRNESTRAPPARNPLFRKVRKNIELFATWDDHDYGINDGGAYYQHKEKSKWTFLKFFDMDTDPQFEQHAGIYHSKTIRVGDKQVLVILLDTRSFKSLWKESYFPPPSKERYIAEINPSKTILGDDQWQWLTHELQKNRIHSSGLHR